MTWFRELFGFEEQSWDDVVRNLSVEGEWMTSSVNGRRFRSGLLTTPTLGQLRAATQSGRARGPLRVQQVVADVTALHQDPIHAGALFQVASQFNLLEMLGPDRTPEHGVTCYAHDHTQGPACALAAAPATVYRNYFVPVQGQVGQHGGRQLDMLSGVRDHLGNAGGALWQMRNGYALCTAPGLQHINAQLQHMDEAGRDRIRAALQIGVHQRVEVTQGGSGQWVSQAFCSALPVAYSPLPSHQWAPFARLILEAAYEATLHAALAQALSGGSSTVFLTLLGGGAFGNDASWIEDALRRAFVCMADCGLDVFLVSYRRPAVGIDRLIDELTRGGVIAPQHMVRSMP